MEFPWRSGDFRSMKNWLLGVLFTARSGRLFNEKGAKEQFLGEILAHTAV
jgi:hypothetical protein